MGLPTRRGGAERCQRARNFMSLALPGLLPSSRRLRLFSENGREHRGLHPFVWWADAHDGWRGRAFSADGPAGAGTGKSMSRVVTLLP